MHGRKIPNEKEVSEQIQFDIQLGGVLLLGFVPKDHHSPILHSQFTLHSLLEQDDIQRCSEDYNKTKNDQAYTVKDFNIQKHC